MADSPAELPADEREALLSLEDASPPDVNMAASSLNGIAAGEAIPSSPDAGAPATRPGFGLQLWAVFVAILGGGLGTLGAFLNELLGGLAFVSAAVIEEVMKPAGVLLLLACWPRALTGRLHTALLAALGGLTFALIEALVYTEIYFPDSGGDFVRYRFTFPIAMHMTSSFLVGLGLNRGIIDWAMGRAPLPKRTRNLTLLAMGLHLVFNISVVVLQLTGVLDFDEAY